MQREASNTLKIMRSSSRVCQAQPQPWWAASTQAPPSMAQTPQGLRAECALMRPLRPPSCPQRLQPVPQYLLVHLT